MFLNGLFLTARVFTRAKRTRETRENYKTANAISGTVSNQRTEPSSRRARIARPVGNEDYTVVHRLLDLSQNQRLPVRIFHYTMV